MCENKPARNSELFADLSEAQQASLAAGQNNFFLQATNLETTADNLLNLGNDATSSQKTKYSLSQITFGLSTALSSDKNEENSFLKNLLSRFFS